MESITFFLSTSCYEKRQNPILGLFPFESSSASLDQMISELNLNEDNKLGLIMKTKTPMKVTKQRKMYKSLTALMTAEYRENELFHFVMTSNNDIVGVELDDVMMYRENVEAVLVFHQADTIQLQRSLSRWGRRGMELFDWTVSLYFFHCLSNLHWTNEC